MSITWPDNENRKQRLIQLTTDCQNYLHESTESYEKMMVLIDKMNALVADAYVKSGLEAPPLEYAELISKNITGEMGIADQIKQVSGIVFDITGVILSFKYLAPAATKVLVKAGVLSAETAGKVIVRTSFGFLKNPVSITVGDVAGQVAGGLLGAVIILAVNLSVDGIVGRVARDKMQHGINGLHPARIGLRMSHERIRILSESVTSVNTSLIAIENALGEITPDQLTKIIQTSVHGDIADSEEVTYNKTVDYLKQFDKDRKAWMDDDPEYN